MCIEILCTVMCYSSLIKYAVIASSYWHTIPGQMTLPTSSNSGQDGGVNSFKQFNSLSSFPVQLKPLRRTGPRVSSIFS